MRNPAFSANGGKDSNRNTDDNRGYDGAKRQLESCWQSLQNEVGNGHAQSIGRPEIAMQHIPKEADIPHWQRIVQTQGLSHGIPFRKRCFRPDHVQNRIPQIAEHQESDECDSQHHKDGLHYTLGHISQHFFIPK